jgi:hypothetical protein
MADYSNWTMEQIIELKRSKEAEWQSLREEIRALARAEERLVRFDELKRRMGDSVTIEDLEMLSDILNTPAGQSVSVDGIDASGKVGEPGKD